MRKPATDEVPGIPDSVGCIPVQQEQQQLVLRGFFWQPAPDSGATHTRYAGNAAQRNLLTMQLFNLFHSGCPLTSMVIRDRVDTTITTMILLLSRSRASILDNIGAMTFLALHRVALSLQIVFRFQ